MKDLNHQAKEQLNKLAEFKQSANQIIQAALPMIQSNLPLDSNHNPYPSIRRNLSKKIKKKISKQRDKQEHRLISFEYSVTMSIKKVYMRSNAVRPIEA